ncbi:MAG: hypothetical protein M1830_001106 [Pleopsidium flavum]|nr:MAG: hypothetical protein M1830_001106 [Pleopsidium flavum]
MTTISLRAFLYYQSDVLTIAKDIDTLFNFGSHCINHRSIEFHEQATLFSKSHNEGLARGSSAGLLSLPASLLLLLSSTPAHTSVHDQQWPYNLPPHIKYFPEDEHVIRRDLDIQHRLAYQSPAGVQKMSGDEGEKFFMKYWHFDWQETDDEGQGIRIPGLRERETRTRDSDLWTNASIPQPFQPPFLLHTDEQTSLNPHFGRFLRFPRAVFPSLEKRAFQCPTGTSNCAISSTATVIITPTVTASSTSSLPTTSSFSSSIMAPIPFPSSSPPSSSTQSSSSSSSPSSSTTTTTPTSSPTQASLTCSSGYRSCPATLGGGCCPTDRACGATECPASSSSQNTFVQAPPPTSASTSTGGDNPAAAPVRPTSIASSPPSTTITTTGTATTESSLTGTACPTGFYQCSAYYSGGCCRVGRDCGMTSCPTAASTAVVDNNGITVVAPTGQGVSGVAPPSATGPVTATTTIGESGNANGGNCAQGWFSCAASAGGGCCPSGYGCGSSCSASVSGGGSVGKIAASAASGRVRVFQGMGLWMMVFGIAVGVLGVGGRGGMLY